MFYQKWNNVKLDKLIDACIHELNDNHSETSEEYATVLNHLEKLYAIKEAQKPRRLSPDTMALITANLIGITMILKHERVDIITSKAMSHVLKPR